MNIIETIKLTKFYGKSRGIIDVDLVVKKGEIFGFIGPNGAGKSTTIRTLLGLIRPTSGQAKIFGKDIVQFGPAIREDVGYLPSEVFYYDSMRARDLLEYSASFYKADQSTLQKRIVELANLLNLPLDKKIDDLSYGNRKKVGIVQGLLHQPSLIILDEPTGGLDPLMQRTFFNLLKRENDRGATILFSSHNLTEVQKMCDRVAIIKDGRILRTDTIRDLVAGTYKRVHLDLTKKISRDAFANLAGVSDLSVDTQAASFLYKGTINELTGFVSKLDLTNLLVVEPDLEEIFMDFYRG